METTKKTAIFYGRRKARPLRVTRQDAMDSVLPQILITPGETSLTLENDIFKYRETWLEIGFGNGDALAHWHRTYPDIGFIGCEPFINGVSNFCKLVADDALDNLRVWNDIAQPLIDALPDASIERVYLLNSDPWPKKRHAKRRVIQQASLSQLARLLKPSGTLTMTTDHANLAEWMWDEAKRHPAFTTPAQSLEDCTTPPEGWLTTRYEAKGAVAGRKQVYLVFTKI